MGGPMTWLLAALAGVAAGVLSGAFGIGGGIVLVPLLALLLGLPQHEAQGVTLAILLLPVGLAAVLAYHRMGAVRWRLVGPLVAGFLAGVATGALAANALPERPLRFVFVAFLLATAARTAWSIRPGAVRRAEDGAPPPRAWVHATWIGAVGGVASGLLGIGGAVVMIPLLVPVLGLTQLEAQGTTLAMMLPPVGLPGVLVYANARGGLPWLVMAVVAAGFLAGGEAGARVAVATRGRRLTGAFVAFQLVVAALLLVRAVR
jgi:uncharacterized membrane protein YfcA